MRIPKPPTDPSAVIIPFGKHKGKTVSELLATDPPYADWVMAQGWVAERFAELHAALSTRGAGNDDTPEHNALQGQFLDHGFRLALLQITDAQKLAKERTNTIKSAVHSIETRIESREGSIRSYLSWNSAARDAATQIEELRSAIVADRAAIKDIEASSTAIYSHAEFEVRGVDVVVTWGVALEDDRRGWRGVRHLELKPSVGDDYPTVLREMKRLREDVLVVGQYTGRGIGEPQMRQMFNASGILVVFVQEIEEKMRASR